MIIMYCSAIFYDAEALIGKDSNGITAWIFRLNPVYAAIRNFRNAIFYGNDGMGFHVNSLLYLGGVSILTLMIGFVLFYKKQDKFILHI